jgi:hypothetical protein
MITVDLYLGFMKNGEEKIMDARIPMEVMMISGNLHLYRKNNKLAELNSFSLLFPLKKLVMCCYLQKWTKLEKKDH